MYGGLASPRETTRTSQGGKSTAASLRPTLGHSHPHLSEHTPLERRRRSSDQGFRERGYSNVVMDEPHTMPCASNEEETLPAGSWWLGTANSAEAAMNYSLGANILLFVIKVVIAYRSNSVAVAAAALDSFLDLVSQLVLFLATYWNRNVDAVEWPIGRSRLEPIGAIIVASLMGTAAIQVIWQSSIRLYYGWWDVHERIAPLMGLESSLVVILGIVLKVLLYRACVQYASRSSTLAALAEDHMNDILSNTMALFAAVIAAASVRYLWWVDPVGAIAISFYIFYRWVELGREQAAQLVGRSADSQFLEEIERLSNQHHENMEVDVVRAFHFGPRFLVEVEVVMPPRTTLVEAHDVSLDLQQKIEAMAQVERAHVHVDYTKRTELEHKWAGDSEDAPANQGTTPPPNGEDHV